MSKHEQPPEPPSGKPTTSDPAPPFAPQLDLIGDMEWGQEWIVDHRTGKGWRDGAPDELFGRCKTRRHRRPRTR